MLPAHTTSGPWYRDRWPWILMSGPAIVIVAGVITTWIAFATADGLVADDYYKQGLAINRTIAREQRAAALGLKASAVYMAETGRVRVLLEGSAPAQITLRIAHPTRAGLDQVVVLKALQPGVYEGELMPGEGGRWLAVLETPDWRLAGDWLHPRTAPLRFDGAARR